MKRAKRNVYNLLLICVVKNGILCTQRNEPKEAEITDPIVLAFANQKGGVGKTTSTVNIAASLGYLGHKTLLIDSDPQGNATSGVGIGKKNLRGSLYEVYSGDCAAADAIRPTEYKNLSVLPATIDLAGAEFDLMDRPRREATLKNALASLPEPFEYILVDCPPSLSLLTVNALTAADGVVIPMQCEYFALEGLTQLMLTVRRVKNAYNPALGITGILITLYDGRLNLSAQVLDELKKYYADKLLTTMIPRNVKLSEAPSYGEPAIYHDKYSRGSLAYLDAAKELIRRVL